MHTIDWSFHVAYDFHWWHIAAALGAFYVVWVLFALLWLKLMSCFWR